MADTWTRVQVIMDEAGLFAAMSMAGVAVDPRRMASAEAADLKRAGVRVLADLGGYPCIIASGPVAAAWLASLDKRVAETAAAVEREMVAGRGDS